MRGLWSLVLGVIPAGVWYFIALSQPPGRTQALAYVMGFVIVAGVIGGRVLSYL
jgi:hypothetical protein